MHRHTPALLALTLLLLLAPQAHARRVCVLSFDREAGRISTAVKAIFGSNGAVDLVLEAGPEDLRNCIQEGHEEVVIIAHALEMDRNSGKVNLGYRKRLGFDERDPAAPVYGPPQVLLPRFFEGLSALIHEQHSRGALTLKKIRVLTCFREAIFERYGFFRDAIGLGIDVDFAPQSRVLSALTGRPVTRFNRRWLRKSLYRSPES